MSKTIEDQAWEAACHLLLGPGREDPGALRYTALSFAGKITPGHPAIRLIEQQRAVLRGDRGPLDEGELALLHYRARLLGLEEVVQI